MFCQKKSRLQKVQSTAGAAAHDLGARASDKLHSAQGVLHGVLEQAPEKIEDWRHTASDALHSAGEALQSVMSTLAAKADSLRDQASDAKEGAVDSARDMKNERQDQVREVIASVQRKARRTKDDAIQREEEFVAAHAPEVVVTSGGEKWLWLLLGVGIGAAVGVLLAPTTGRRSRALIKDKLVHGAHVAGDAGEAITRKATDLSNRAQGVVHETIGSRSDGSGELADDVTIADRVRSELGRLEIEFGLDRINIDCCDGVITVRGPAGDESTAEVLVAAARKIPGVRDVKNEMAVDSPSEAFVG